MPTLLNAVYAEEACLDSVGTCQGIRTALSGLRVSALWLWGTEGFCGATLKVCSLATFPPSNSHGLIELSTFEYWVFEKEMGFACWVQGPKRKCQQAQSKPLPATPPPAPAECRGAA